jgi:hypothetical protein
MHLPRTIAMTKATAAVAVRLQADSADKVAGLVRKQLAGQLAFLPTETRDEVIAGVDVRTNLNRTSLTITLAGQAVIQTEFGTRRTAAQPWLRSFQRSLAMPLRQILTTSITIKTKGKSHVK